MPPNCFSCLGQRIECINERRYSSYAGEEYCIHKAVAKQDEARLSIGDLESIKLREMFAQYLFENNRKDEALRVLPAS